MTKKSFHLKHHLQQEHRVSPLQTYLKEIVYGGSDGIVTTFAVVAGFTGASAGASIATYSIATVLLFGLANLFADGASMGLSNFLSLRAEKDVYKGEQEKEYHEVKNNPDMEKAETIEILVNKGFTEQQAQELTRIYATNQSYWVEWMMNNELELPNPTGENPFLTGLATFSAFIVFGSIPLLPYILGMPTQNIFMYSCIAAFSALVVLGLIRFKVTGENILRSVLEIVALGGTSAAIAYFVGTFFKL